MNRHWGPTPPPTHERLDRLVPTPVPHDDEVRDLHALSCAVWETDDDCDCREET